MTSHRPTLFALLCALLICGATPSLAFDQPSVNLGLTSFLDGGPPAGPGWYYAGYLQYYTANSLVNHPLDPQAKLDVWSYVNQVLYQSDQEFLWGGKWGADIIIPVVNISSDSTSTAITETSGLGDLLIGPYLQWDPIMGKNGPIFMHRVELQMIFPTGRYDSNKALNPGSNFFSFNPYWAGTLFLTPRWTTSCRVHYLWNAKNKKPWIPFGAYETQAGQAWHMNFASGYEIVPKVFRLGLNGYYFKQFSASKTNGVHQPAREQVLGLGPGAVVHFNKDTHLFANAYFESSVKSRPKGDRYIIRLVHHF